jgi:hypothetical protein
VANIYCYTSHSIQKSLAMIISNRDSSERSCSKVSRASLDREGVLQILVKDNIHFIDISSLISNPADQVIHLKSTRN